MGTEAKGSPPLTFPAALLVSRPPIVSNTQSLFRSMHDRLPVSGKSLERTLTNAASANSTSAMRRPPATRTEHSDYHTQMEAETFRAMAESLKAFDEYLASRG